MKWPIALEKDLSARAAILEVLEGASAPMGSYHLCYVAGIRQRKRLRLFGKVWEFGAEWSTIPPGVFFPIVNQFIEDGVVHRSTFADGTLSYQLVRTHASTQEGAKQ